MQFSKATLLVLLPLLASVTAQFQGPDMDLYERDLDFDGHASIIEAREINARGLEHLELVARDSFKKGIAARNELQARTVCNQYACEDASDCAHYKDCKGFCSHSNAPRGAPAGAKRCR